VAASPGASAAPSIRVHQGPGQGHGEHAEDDLGDRDRVLVAAGADQGQGDGGEACDRGEQDGGVGGPRPALRLGEPFGALVIQWPTGHPHPDQRGCRGRGPPDQRSQLGRTEDAGDDDGEDAGSHCEKQPPGGEDPLRRRAPLPRKNSLSRMAFRPAHWPGMPSTQQDNPPGSEPARRCCDAPASRGGHPPVSTRRGATWCCASNSAALRVVAYRHVLRPVVECLEHGDAPPSNQHRRQGTR
jgi:hypothetical protein